MIVQRLLLQSSFLLPFTAGVRHGMNAAENPLATYRPRNIRREVVDFNGSVTVIDNGLGIPTDDQPETGKSALETVLTILHAGVKCNNQNTNNYNNQ